MRPHLQNVLGTIPPSVAMSAVLRRWEYTIWRDIQKADVELWFSDFEELSESLGWYVSNTLEPSLRYPPLLHSEGITLLHFHQYWQELASITNLRHSMHALDGLVDSIASHQAELQKLVDLRFVIPFTVVEKLWTCNDLDVQEQSSRLLPFLEDAFSSHSEYYEEHHARERLVFISVLLNHLNCTDFTSYIATSTRGQEFIRFVHGQIISHDQRLPGPDHWTTDQRRELMSDWTRATQRVTEIGHLPPGYFAPIPEPHEESTAQATDAALPFPVINPDDPPREESESGAIPRSDHEMDGGGEDVLGPVERSEQGDRVGGLGTDERV
ncbi:hypothetical protein Moror_4385 [Moniliophthora roreri MCA 2997]|uniref:Uncharacterized protein n=1 Tax=Moniliophthora roreri (strain MCA 2997) TaxID=1381753 RepID=V2XIB4_MONRO|nr:hypothetical protein Moror_4385 [Moniliophthora roreri MCA 2997]